MRELLVLTGPRAVDVHARDWLGPEGGFRGACKNGHLEVVRELLALEGDRAVDVHAGPRGVPGAGFREACTFGHEEIVRELQALTGQRAVNVHAGNGVAFCFAFQGGNVGVTRELLALAGSRTVPLQDRLDAGLAAVQAGKDAVWDGTSTRQGRRAALLLRAE